MPPNILTRNFKIFSFIFSPCPGKKFFLPREPFFQFFQDRPRGATQQHRNTATLRFLIPLIAVIFTLYIIYIIIYIIYKNKDNIFLPHSATSTTPNVAVLRRCGVAAFNHIQVSWYVSWKRWLFLPEPLTLFLKRLTIFLQIRNFLPVTSSQVRCDLNFQRTWARHYGVQSAQSYQAKHHKVTR